MAVQHVALEAIADAHAHVELAAVLVGLELQRPVEVALAERRVLQQLAIAVAVPIGRLDLAGCVEADPELLLAVGELPGVRRPARDDDVVLLAERHAPEHRAQHAATAVDVEDLVALAVAVEAVELARRFAD